VLPHPLRTLVLMRRGDVVERVERLAGVDVVTLSNSAALAALKDARRIQSWIEGRTALLRRQIRETATSVAVGRECADDAAVSSRASGRRDERRADAIGRVPEFQAALHDGLVTGEHVDVVAATLASLNADERGELAAAGAEIVSVAGWCRPDGFRDIMREFADAIRRDRGESLRNRRKRDTRLVVWWDQHSGMWRLRGRLDPEMGAIVSQQLDAALDARKAQPVPECCPEDPGEKIDFLRAHALADLVSAGSGGGGPGGGGVRAEVTIVVSTGGAGGAGGGGYGGERPPPGVDPSTWTCPPGRIDAGPMQAPPPEFVTDLVRRGVARVFTVLTADGQVVEAPGRLDLGRTTRLANRAQRRALHALYATCAVPECRVDFRRCRLHHVEWWRHGGRTDLANLVPLCRQHHGAVHDEGWQVVLGPRRELTVVRPDGRTVTTGPPGRGP